MRFEKRLRSRVRLVIDSRSFPHQPLLQQRMAVRIAIRLFTKRWRGVFAALVCVLLAATQLPLLKHSEAQATRPTLISEETSTRAIAVESITRKREPFSPTNEVRWGNDNRTRIMLFAMGIDPGISIAEVTASAEDGSHQFYSLPVEHVGPVPQQEWITSIIVRLPEDLTDPGDVLVGISYRGTASNRVRVAIGHVGGGPPDDSGSVPTPATLTQSPTPSATAGSLTTGEVETVI